MIIIDTSLWVHQLRQKGDPAKRRRVEELLSAGDAAWCSPIRLELWRGVRGEKEARVLKEYEQVLPEYSLSNDVWQEACELAARCRRSGKTAPFADILIAACARHHSVQVERNDAHFDFLMQL
ncbi:MAG: PIN domain-containing protein [Terrimicrobiaceae bacterium]